MNGSKMEFNAARQYSHPSTGPYTVDQSSTAMQMMYSYRAHSFESQQQPQSLQAMSRLSPTQSTWAVPRTHHQYYAMPRGAPMGSSEDSDQMARENVNVASSPSVGPTAFSNTMNNAGQLATTDYFPGVIDTSPWGQKVCEELEAFSSLDADVTEFNHSTLGQDENTPIIDLRQYADMGQHESGRMPSYNHNSLRRMSGSSFSMSSTSGVQIETTPYEETVSSETIPYTQAYESWNHSEPSSSHLLSPLASPRRPQYDGIICSGSRSRASPTSHNNVRSSPYTLESGRYKRWNTAHAPTSTPATSRAMAHFSDRYSPYGSRPDTQQSMPAYSPGAHNNFYPPAQQNTLYRHSLSHSASSQSLYTQDHSLQLEVPRPLPSQGPFRLLQSNANRHGGFSSHFADLSDPPDLYSSLHEEASIPPASDMNPTDPDLVPHEQDLRFVGDLYTPRWVRGHGNKREGWCGLCKPGRWLVLKNSAFWYDKSFTHGISAATGVAFKGPHDTRRTEGNLDVWEGLCGSCGEWIALVSSKKKGTTWFRHAYKCHTHPKVKDGPKRRREAPAGRARTVPSTSAKSSYPTKQDASQADAVSYQHSKATPITSGGTSQSFGMPSASSSMPLPNFGSSPTSTQLSLPSYSTNTCYPVAASAAETSHSSKSSAPFNEAQTELFTMYEPAAGLFTTPLQGFSTFSENQSYTRHPSHQISEPELVGIRTTTSSLDSIASMI